MIGTTSSGTLIVLFGMYVSYVRFPWTTSRSVKGAMIDPRVDDDELAARTERLLTGDRLTSSHVGRTATGSSLPCDASPLLKALQASIELKLPKLNTGVRFPSSALAKHLVRGYFRRVVLRSRALPVPRPLVESGRYRRPGLHESRERPGREVPVVGMDPRCVGCPAEPSGP